MVYDWLHRLSFLLLPPTCLLCHGRAEPGPGQATRDLCPACEADLPVIRNPCARCGLPLPEEAAGFTCGACQHSPPAWDACTSATAYAPPVSALVHRFKSRCYWPAGKVLSELLADRLRERYTALRLPDAIVPVPLHRERLWRRGFNQSTLIARELGRQLRIPVQEHWLQRSQATLPQQSLDATQRRRNLKNAFRVATDALPPRIALVDDVVTTGSTVAELSRLLKQHGVHSVDVWCLARTPKPGE